MTLIGALIVIVLSSPQDTRPPVGMILHTEGEVFIQRGAARDPARLANPLYPGDQVVTASGQVTFVFCPSAERATIKNGSRVELSANAIVMRAGSAPTRTPARCMLPKVALGAENMEHIGGLRPRGTPPISVFVGGPITTTRPVFEWGPVPGAASYQLTVKDEAGNTVWQQKAVVPPAAYPPTLPALPNGSYQLEIHADAEGKVIAQQATTFQVKPNADFSRQAGDDLASKVTRAFELEDAGYFAEAAVNYRALRAADPNDERIVRRLTWLYWQAGLIAAATELIDHGKGK